MAIQQLLIRFFLEPLAKIMNRVPQKIRDIGFIASFLCIIFLYMGRGSGILDFRYLLFFALGCLGLGVMILCTLPTDMKPILFRKSLIFLWLGIGGLMLLSGVLFNVDSLPEAILFLFVYPIFFIVWNQTDSASVFGLLFRGIEISFWIYFACCLLFFPATTVRYSGMFTNVNGTAGYLALVAVCLLVDCLNLEKMTGRLIRKIISLGVCIALLLYTGSRTGIIEVFAVLIVSVVIWFFRLKKQQKLYFLRNLSLIAVSIVLFFNVTLYILQFGYNAGRSVYSLALDILSADSSGGLGSSADHPEEPPQSVIHPDDSSDILENRFDAEDQSLNQFSTGRIDIWKGYLKQLNLFGHKDSGTVTITFGGVEKVYHTTHMTILQIAYENGLIAGILYLTFNLAAGIYSLIYALRRKEDPYAMVPLMVSVAYAAYSLLANTGVSFWYLSTLLYYLVQFPLMIKDNSQSKGKEVLQKESL